MAHLELQRVDVTAKGQHSKCVLCLLLLCMLVIIFVYSNAEFDSSSFFSHNANHAKAESVSHSTLPMPKDNDPILSRINRPKPQSTVSTLALAANNIADQTNVDDQHNAIIPSLICIGGTFTGSSTLQQLLCQLEDIQCCSSSIVDNEPDHVQYDYTSDSLFNVSRLVENNYIPVLNVTDFSVLNLDYTLAQFQFDVDAILESIPMDKYVTNYCALNAKPSNNKRTFIRHPRYFQNPVTAAIFANFAWQYETKIIFQVREPIDRWWSSELVEPYHQSYTDYLRNQDFMQRLMNFIHDPSRSQDDMIAVYYSWYFSIRGHIDFEIANSFYCVHLMIWLKQFDRLFDDNADTNRKTSEYFKVVQTRYLFEHLPRATEEIYCWMHAGECGGNDVKQRINVKQIKSPDMTENNQTWSEIMQKTFIFKGCNEKIDEILQQRPGLVLGEWKSWNEMYDETKDQHMDDD